MNEKHRIAFRFSRRRNKGGTGKKGRKEGRNERAKRAVSVSMYTRVVKVHRPFNFGFPRAENIRVRHTFRRGIA